MLYVEKKKSLLNKDGNDQPRGHERDTSKGRSSRGGGGGHGAGRLFFGSCQLDSKISASVIRDSAREGGEATLVDGGGASVVEGDAEGLAGLLATEGAGGRAPELGVSPDAIIAIRDEGGVAALLLGVDGEVSRENVGVGPEACGRDEGVGVVNKSFVRVEPADVRVESAGLDASTMNSRNEQTRKYNEYLHLILGY